MPLNIEEWIFWSFKVLIHISTTMTVSLLCKILCQYKFLTPSKSMPHEQSNHDFKMSLYTIYIILAGTIEPMHNTLKYKTIKSNRKRKHNKLQLKASCCHVRGKACCRRVRASVGSGGRVYHPFWGLYHAGDRHQVHDRRWAAFFATAFWVWLIRFSYWLERSWFSYSQVIQLLGLLRDFLFYFDYQIYILHGILDRAKLFFIFTSYFIHIFSYSHLWSLLKICWKKKRSTIDQFKVCCCENRWSTPSWGDTAASCLTR